ncbi:MAG: class I SAM-dependent methyltransferase [Anaerolineales bacterium]
MDRLPVCDYEGSDYQERFWDQGGREYEDRVEAIALSRLLPPQGGERLLELGAGAGRNTPRYVGYRQVILLDYSFTQLQKARRRLGENERFVYVAADIYRLPFRRQVFDAATMIRTLHHLIEPARALEQVANVLAPGALFILEFANKRNLKAILRYWLRRQSWSPFTLETVEFAPLNFDFHPRAVQQWLEKSGFTVERRLTVSHFRLEWLKRHVPLNWLVTADALLQWSGEWWQLTPSVFLRARRQGALHSASLPPIQSPGDLFRCLGCGQEGLSASPQALRCPNCGKEWPIREGIYDFREREEG